MEKSAKKNKKLKIIPKIVMLIIIIIIVYCLLVCMPLYGTDKECDISQGGYEVKINGIDIWYNIYNRMSHKTPIYILAGGTGLSSDYLNSNLSFLAETHPVIFYDGRCTGRSEYTKNLSNCTFENYAEDLEALRKYLTPDDDIILVAHSYGGATAMQYAISYTKNIENMILISSVGVKTNIFFSDAYYKTGLPPLNQEKANKWYVDNIDIMYGDFIQNKNCIDIFEGSSFNYALMMKNNGRDRYDFSDELSNIDIPVLILVGGEKETVITNLQVAEELNSTLKNSKLIQFTNSGHFCFAEEYDAFKTTVTGYLNYVS